MFRVAVLAGNVVGLFGDARAARPLAPILKLAIDPMSIEVEAVVFPE